MRTFLKFTIVLIVIASYSSCTSAYLASSWTKSGYTAQPYKKILVLAIAKSTSNRAAVEGSMVKELNKKGYHAVSTLDVFPNFNPGMKLERAVMVQKLKENNIDGMMILSLLDVK